MRCSGLRSQDRDDPDAPVASLLPGPVHPQMFLVVGFQFPGLNCLFQVLGLLSCYIPHGYIFYMRIEHIQRDETAFETIATLMGYDHLKP